MLSKYKNDFFNTDPTPTHTHYSQSLGTWKVEKKKEKIHP